MVSQFFDFFLALDRDVGFEAKIRLNDEREDGEAVDAFEDG